MKKYRLFLDDNINVIKRLKDNSIHAVVTDPPFGLGKEPQTAEMLADWLKVGHHDHKNKTGFMGKKWDAFVPQPAFWKEVHRVLKPGGYVLAFFGARTYDLGVLSLRLAGFEIRDTLSVLVGNAFPKSSDIGKKIDKHLGVKSKVVGKRKHPTLKDTTKLDRQGKQQFHGKNKIREEWPITEPTTQQGKQWLGWGYGLKPAFTPIVVARKPLEGTLVENVLKYGVGALNIDGSRIPIVGAKDKAFFENNHNVYDRVDDHQKNLRTSFKGGWKKMEHRNIPEGRFPANVIMEHTIKCRVSKCHPSCPCFIMDEQSGDRSSSRIGNANNPKRGEKHVATSYGQGEGKVTHDFRDSGGASRFFYCSKISPKDRHEGLETRNDHPTVKQTSLMRYLLRLCVPAGGLVLDPFMGSGSTGKAAMLEGFRFIGVEMDEAYFDIACQRIKFVISDGKKTT